MSFLDTIGMVETPEQEAQRLAQAPEGSITHALSAMPVTIEGWVEDMLIELPKDADAGIPGTVVVVPISFQSRPGTEDGVKRTMPYRRHDGYWECAVIASDDERYKVGGCRMSIPTAELCRGTIRELK